MRAQRYHHPAALERAARTILAEGIARAAPERIEHFRAKAAELFAQLEAECGKDVAREVWVKALPKRRRGNPVPDAKEKDDTEAWLLDAYNREVLGMTGEQSAELLHETRGLSTDAEGALRKLSRLRKLAYANGTPPTREQWEVALKCNGTAIAD